MTEKSPVAFDPVHKADAEVLLGMARAFHIEDGHPLSVAGEAAVRHIVEGEPFARAWIVRSAGRTVGYVVITLGYSIEYGGRDGFIDDFYLVPEVRGQGLGRKLLDFALSQATQLGITTLHLEVESGNESANRLYRSVGFEETGRRLMRCRLNSPAAPAPPSTACAAPT